MSEFSYGLEEVAGTAATDAADDTADLEFAELAIDPATGDVQIPIVIIYGADAIAQRIRVRLRFFLGEWFLDLREGVPYYRDVLVKNPDLELVRSLFRRVLLRTPGVQAIRKFETKLLPTRELTFNFEVKVKGGKIYRSQPNKFIVTTP